MRLIWQSKRRLIDALSARRISLCEATLAALLAYESRRQRGVIG